MKNLILAALLLSGCAAVQTKKKCTPILLVESPKCYDTCLNYARLSESELKKESINRSFLSCVDEVCKGAYVCLENIEQGATRDGTKVFLKKE